MSATCSPQGIDAVLDFMYLLVMRRESRCGGSKPPVQEASNVGAGRLPLAYAAVGPTF